MAQDEPGLRCDSDVVLVRRDGAQPRGATSAFDRGDISLMASHDAVVRKLRAVYWDPVVARQSGWEGSDNQDGHFGGRGEEMIVAARR